MNPSDSSPPKQMRFVFLQLIAFVILIFGNVIDQTFRWTDHFHGFFNGLIQGIFLGIAWFICQLPWSGVIFALYRWRKWKRFRSHWVLAPVVLMLMLSIIFLVVDPPLPRNRFKHFVKTELPRNIQDLHYFFSGGGFADYSDIYYFKTSPEEVDRLVAEMNLVKDKISGYEGWSSTSISVFSDCPDSSTWEGAKRYRGGTKNQCWFYRLITNSSRTEVYILIGSI